jgi:virginiamycin B lyase
MICKKRFPTLLVLAVAALAQHASAETHTIQMTDRPPYLQPQVIEANVGDTVVWQNNGPQLAHAVIDGDLRIYSDDIQVGKTWSHTFDHAGTYAYLCQRHFFMRGTIFVRTKDGSLVSAPDHSYQRAFREFVVPTLNAVPRMIAVSRFDDSIWFTEGGGQFYGFEDIPPQNKLGHIDGQDRIVEYATPPTDAQGTKLGVDSVVMDHRGNVWFTERVSNRIGYLDKSQTMHEFPLPTKNGEVLGIDVDNSDTVWFAERFANRIGWMSKEGQITEIQMPEADSEPRAVFADSKDRIWYTARAGNAIGYYDKKLSKFTSISVPTDKARPAGLCEASDGTVYFVEMVANKIGKLVGNQIFEYPTPTKFAAPFKCAVDQADNVWFTEVFGNSVGKLDTRTGEVVEFQIPTPDSRPGGIATDHKGRVWFTEQKGNKIGVFDPSLAADNTGPSGPPSSVSKSSPQIQLGTKSNSEQLSSQDFHLPMPQSGPGGDLLESGGGWLWFSEVYGNKLGAFDLVSKKFREISMLTPVSMPVGMAKTSDGILWVAEFRGNRLARVDPQDDSVREFALQEPEALPAGVAVDEADNIWMALMGAGSIARFDRKSEQFEQFEMPGGDVAPFLISADGRGALWVTASNRNGNYLARFDLGSKRFEVFHLPTDACGPAGVLVDEDAVWVTESQAGKLAKFELGLRRWKEFSVPVAHSEPVRLAKDTHGRLWVADGGGIGTAGGNAVEMFDPLQGSFTVVTMKTRKAKPAGIARAGDGNIWFTQMGSNLLSQITFKGEHL